MPIRTIAVALFTVALLWLAPAPAHAIDCASEVRSAEKTLAEMERQVGTAREANRPRIRGFLDEARKLIDQARADCKVAETEFAKATAIAKVALAQGELAAAHIFIKLD